MVPNYNSLTAQTIIWSIQILCVEDRAKSSFFHFRLKITVTDFKGIKTRNTFRENRYLEK
ncbi:hypothetical protein EXQ32_18910 [Clostridium botulinum]|nr:hypothetical protein [Clostridium botulinum]